MGSLLDCACLRSVQAESLAVNKTTKSENRDGPSQGAAKLITVALKIQYLPLYSDCFGVGDGSPFD